MQVIQIAAGLIVAAISGLAVFSLLRRWAQAIRYPRGAPPGYRPVLDPNPPAPVVRSPWVWVVGCAGLVWAAGHLTAAATWCATGWWVDRSATGGMVAAYFCWAAITTSIGSAMLLARQPYGRRAVALGQFLFVLGAFMGLAISLLVPLMEQLPTWTREMAPTLAAALLAHLVIDTAIGYAAQRVGRPGKPPEGASASAQDPNEAVLDPAGRAGGNVSR